MAFSKLDPHQLSQKEHEIPALAKRVILVSDSGVPYSVRSPVHYKIDGVDVDVALDTAVPSNNVPLPTVPYTALGGSPWAFNAGTISASTLRVTLASDQPAILVSLPGAATEIKQDAIIAELGDLSAQLPTTLGSKTAANSLSVTLPSDQGPLSVSQNGIWNIADITGTVSLPTGASTEATLLNVEVDTTNIASSTSAINTKLPAVLGQTTSAASLSVVVASDQPALGVDTTNFPVTVSTGFGTPTVDTLRTAAELGVGGVSVSTTNPVPTSSKQAISPVGFVRNDYTVTNVSTGAYVQLIASTSSLINELEIFDSSGQTLVLAIGAVASEVDYFYIFPGGNGRIPAAIPSGSRVSIKAVSALANAGEISINLYG